MKMQAGNGWNALFWCNHDQPRIVSRMGDETTYWKESAKMLAGMIHLMRGTPYIYQGEEIGMLNAHYPSIDQYRDVESLNYYQILLDQGETKEQALETLGARSRDNSRTPMQWSKEKYCGFSDAEPWLPVSFAFRDEITVEEQQNDEDSILAFYKKLIKLRKTNAVIAKGMIEFLQTGIDKVVAYRRTLGSQQLTIFCNLDRGEHEVKLDEVCSGGKILLENYKNLNVNEDQNTQNIKNIRNFAQQMAYTLRPYEFLVIESESGAKNNDGK